MQYREDIDGLRAFAVLSVVFFHLGFLPNGYLGVDIFFVISGYLITSIIYAETLNGKFCVWDFYLRRIRRIVPLLLFTTSLALVAGYFFMLPDDLDNLGQAVFASNLSANNILMYITSSDYWASRNDYKPLMHTWSLGVEEQFYLLFPFLFLLLKRGRAKFIALALVVLSLASLAVFAASSSSAQRFYLLPHRLFEFTVGGSLAVYLHHRHLGRTRTNQLLLYVSLVTILVVIGVPSNGYNETKIILITSATAAMLVLGVVLGKSSLYSTVFTNPIVVWIGKLSFSIYMMHQVVLAFARYMFFEKIDAPTAFGLILITFGVSYFTYRYVENPFRNKSLVATKVMASILVPLLVAGSSAGLFVYSQGGIVRDYPALDVYRGAYQFERKLFRITTNIHIQYNEDIRKLDKDFEPSEHVKVLVIGNSFGRDVSNIWLESGLSSVIQLRFFDMARALEDSTLTGRMATADLIIIAEYGSINREWVENLERHWGIELDYGKVWAFGVKDFGTHNGVHYTRLPRINDFSSYTTQVRPSILAKNEASKQAWGDRYVDLIEPVTMRPGGVLVFTPDGKFISPDTGHLTAAGAGFYADLLGDTLHKLVRSVNK